MFCRGGKKERKNRNDSIIVWGGDIMIKVGWVGGFYVDEFPAWILWILLLCMMDHAFCDKGDETKSIDTKVKQTLQIFVETQNASLRHHDLNITLALSSCLKPCLVFLQYIFYFYFPLIDLFVF